jgi:hypothetical protein
MNTPGNQENLMQDYFINHREVIPDDGFTKKVMRSLPEKNKLLSKKDILVYTSLFLGAGIFMFKLPDLNEIFFTVNPSLILFLILSSVCVIISIIYATDTEFDFL